MRTVVRYSVISWFSTSALWERTSTPAIDSAIPDICETAFLAASDQLSPELPTKSSTLICWAMPLPPFFPPSTADSIHPRGERKTEEPDSPQGAPDRHAR